MQSLRLVSRLNLISSIEILLNHSKYPNRFFDTEKLNVIFFIANRVYVHLTWVLWNAV